MAFTKEQQRQIYNRTTGYCHLCHKKLSFKNYNATGTRGAWHVEHSNPRSKGGTDRMNNLFAACIRCNLDKSSLTTRTARGWNGKNRAPLSPDKRKKAKGENGFAGAIAGGVAGGLLGGPIGAVVGAVSGAFFGSSGNPDRG